MIDKAKLIDVLEERRKELGVTQADLAQKACLSNSQNWSNIVHHRRHVSVDAINRVAGILGGRFEVIFLGQDEILELES